METIKYEIRVKGMEAGYLKVAPVPSLGEDTVEIVDIYMRSDFRGLKLATDAVRLIFKKNEQINRIVISPEPQSMQFWTKIGFQRMNDSYLITFRGH